MAKLNERKTEDIVRQHFQKDKLFSNITFEEQSSNNPRITKLLKNASKKGNGVGKPEFIISINDERDLLIVVECKADILKHESKNRDKFSDYAVGGVLLYSSYLSKEYDVLSLAVSGVREDNIKVSYFLQKIGTDTTEQIFGNRLITLGDILTGLRQDEAKKSEKYEELLEYSKLLNKQLYKLKIKEDKRSLLVSGILIALNNQGFYKSYASLATNQMLANTLVDTIREQLLIEDLQSDKTDKLMENYSFINSHPSLINKNKKELKELKELIDKIDKNINNYSKTYQYHDVLGQFYIEFLRYSNADKGLGIVLTPPHITEFFTDIVDIKTDDIVFDNCTGTGGFLVAAMKKMIKKCYRDSDQEKNIKQQQLYGIEYQPEIYPLAVSNMLLHGDGKSNIIDGNCFNKDIIKIIKTKKPTIGYLNPPYSNPEKNEFEFILNNLNCLEKYGQCVAIIPINCVLAQSGKELRFKTEILSKHTLKAVFSMPDELFHNSKVTTNTCIIVIQAHIPHPPREKTFFGYFRDDGFYKRKTKGRFDYDKKWNTIKNKWLDLYVNKEEEKGLSVVKSVSSKDKWCAEKYMNTDYTLLSKFNFQSIVNNYIGYKMIYDSISDIKNDDKPNKKIFDNLNTSDWRFFSCAKIFDIEKCKCSNASLYLEDGNDIYYIGAKKKENGIMNKVISNNKFISKGNAIVFIGDGKGSIGYSLYQPVDFIGSSTLSAGYSKKLNVYNGLFLVTVLDLERYRYSFGIKYGKEVVEKSKIKLPAKDNKPDWDYMENYIKSLSYSNLL